MMPIKFYSTMTRKKEVFRPIKEGQVGMYNCGPTVYDYAHIGNFRSYVFADLLRRYFEWKGFKVKQVMNLTDVDDKIIKKSAKEGIPSSKLTERYEKAFFEDIKSLNITPATLYPRATEHIKEMVSIVQALERKGYAYKGEDGIYYKISKFKGYGKLSGTDLKGLKAGARVRQDEYDKTAASDFALWKFWNREDGNVFWETELGKGRPGWHIECSAMSMKYLGETFDIHTGGVDLIFPHHENEIAQSEAATGKRFVRYWIHNEHLLVDGQKMAKSAGNFFTLRDLLKKGYSPKAIRFLLLSAHYRTKLNFTMDAIKSAEATVKGVENFVAEMQADKGGTAEGQPKAVKRESNPQIQKVIEKARRDFEKALDDDLNTPLALKAIFDMMKEVNRMAPVSEKDAKLVLDAVFDADKVLALELSETGKVWHSPEEAEKEVRELILKRDSLRSEKKWKEADSIRESLKKKGIIVEDTAQGPRWKRL
ncbi:MAG: cysteine--tRNA ligase [Candidatus Aenigmarchaeota archaeon]|nr:cysteine--tRNA ligase [Candidatus Aenigmarchaeota archaeon]